MVATILDFFHQSWGTPTKAQMNPEKKWDYAENVAVVVLDYRPSIEEIPTTEN